MEYNTILYLKVEVNHRVVVDVKVMVVQCRLGMKIFKEKKRLLFSKWIWTRFLNLIGKVQNQYLEMLR